MPSLGTIQSDSQKVEKRINEIKEQNSSISQTELARLRGFFAKKLVKRREKRLISLLDRWSIKTSCNLSDKQINASNLANNLIRQKKQHLSYQDSYWHRILPFHKSIINDRRRLHSLSNELSVEMEHIFSLETEIMSLLNSFSSHTPFENKTLSHLVAVELMLNSLHHAFPEKNTESNECYFSTTLNNKLRLEDIIAKHNRKKIEDVIANSGCSWEDAEKLITPLSNHEAERKLEHLIRTWQFNNIDSERIRPSWNFFKKSKSLKLINRSYIEFTFLDFGEGIPTTLKTEYLRKIKKASTKNELNEKHNEIANEDTKILEYAFLLDSSRIPFEKNLEIQGFVPRGLFFLADIIKRYEGILIVRSNTGELIYDFSQEGDIKNCVIYSELKYFFPGTMVNILLPEKQKENVTISAIEKINRLNNKTVEQQHISILELENEIVKTSGGVTLEIFYKKLFKKLNNEFDSCKDSATVFYLDFAGVNNSYIDSKLFLYLANSPKINKNTNVIILNPGDKEIVRNAQQMIISFKPFIFRPIPCVSLDGEIIWIGIKHIDEQKKLNELMNYEQYTLAIEDFKDVDSLTGNVISVDWIQKRKDSGNVTRNIAVPCIPDCLDYCLNQLPDQEIRHKIESSKENKPRILLDASSHVYYTSGGYYQYEFLRFINLLYDPPECEKIAIHLWGKFLYIKKGTLPQITTILSVTLSSQLLARAVRKVYRKLRNINDKTIKEPRLIRLAHYYDFHKEEGLNYVNPDDQVLLVNDVISTGNLVKDIWDSIELRGASVNAIFSIVDSRVLTEDIQSHKEIQSLFIPEIDDKTIYLTKRPIRKWKKNYENRPQVKKINPIINAPTTMDVSHSEAIKVLVPDNEEFLKNNVGAEFLLVGNFVNNHVYHNYFVKTEDLFLSKKGPRMLKYLIDRLIIAERERYRYEQSEDKSSRSINKSENFDFVFYPIYSGVEALEDYQLRQLFPGNRSVEIYPLPRVDTPKGWRFTFPPKLLNEKTRGKSVFILDDGSCTGETIIQMIDSICFLDVAKITVLSIFARIEDFQREFFSRIKQMTVKRLKTPQEKLQLKLPLNDEVEEHIVNVHIYFGLHLHIPFYPSIKVCPFKQEQYRLEELQKKSQKPNAATEYMELRLNELNIYDLQIPRKTEKVCDYLPRIRGTDKIDSLKLYAVRDKIGRLESYRLYQQYFEDLDFESQEDLETIMAVVIHEPSVIITVRQVIPDIYALLRKTIDEIVFDNKLDTSDLYYDWSKDSLVRFLLIVSEDILSDSNKLWDLIRIIDQAKCSQCLNYVVFSIWDQLIDNRKNDLLYNSIADIWNKIKADSYYRTGDIRDHIHHLIVSYNWEKGANSIPEAYRALQFYFLNEESSRESHTVIDRKLYRLAIGLKNETDKKLLKEILYNNGDAIDAVDKLVFKNLRLLNKDDFLKTYFKTDFVRWFDDDDSVIQIMNNLKKIYSKFRENINTKEMDITEIKLQFSRLLFKLRDGHLQTTVPFGEYCMDFSIDVLEEWKSMVNQRKEQTGWANIQWNLATLESYNQISKKISVHKKGIAEIFSEFIDNKCKIASTEYKEGISLNYAYKESETNLYFHIIQNKPFIEGNRERGLKSIRAILRAFNGGLEIRKTASKTTFVLTFRK